MSKHVHRWNRISKFTCDFTFQDAVVSALEDGDESRAQYLMKKNPSNIRDDDRTNVLLFSARRGFDDAVEIILENDDNIIYDYGLNECTALHHAAKYGHTDIVRMLIKYGADLDAQDKCGATPLHYAASSEYPDIVQILIENGADPNKADFEGVSVLCAASKDKKFYSSKGVACVLRLLIEGARIDKKALEEDEYKMLEYIEDGTRSRLFFAVIYGLIDITFELLCVGESIEKYMLKMDKTHLLERISKCPDRGQFTKMEHKVFSFIAFMLIREIPSVAYKVFHGIQSYMTYGGIMCAHGFTYNDSEIKKYKYLTHIKLPQVYWNYYRTRVWPWSWMEHRGAEIIPAGITKAWHNSDHIYHLDLEHKYVYSHEEMSWIWKCRIVDTNLVHGGIWKTDKDLM